ncbi:MAG TPA: hypothetical protein ENO14_01565 [Chromatiales bacterium]|nr:hypothetical protein [Chromatiales bacterium]
MDSTGPRVRRRTATARRPNGTRILPWAAETAVRRATRPGTRTTAAGARSHRRADRRHAPATRSGSSPGAPARGGKG